MENKLVSPITGVSNQEIDSLKRMKLMTMVLSGAAIFVAGSLQAADVEANFSKHCMSCHAKDGSGNTKMGKKEGTKDYRDAKIQEAMKDDEAFKRIKDGQTENGKERMKPFKDKLSDDEIKALVAHFRSFGKK